jgi:hypothetical protein
MYKSLKKLMYGSFIPKRKCTKTRRGRENTTLPDLFAKEQHLKFKLVAYLLLYIPPNVINIFMQVKNISGGLRNNGYTYIHWYCPGLPDGMF